MAVSGTIKNVRAIGMACAVPETVVTNDAFVSRFGVEGVQKFEKMVSVKARHIAMSTETASDFAYKAAKALQAKGIWSIGDVDAIVFVSQTPDYVLPSTACVLQHRLGVQKDCLAFDVNLGCSGFVYGFFISSSLLQMPGVKKVLFLGGDCISKVVSPFDQSATMLFGDAGFAAVLVRDDAATPIDYSYSTDGGGYKAIIARGRMLAGRYPELYAGEKRQSTIPLGLKEYSEGIRRSAEDLSMDGMEVFNFTINEVPDLIKAQMLACGLTPDQVDLLILHQANKFVLKQVAMATGFSMKKVPICMDRYGNTSMTSIPLTLCDYYSLHETTGMQKLLMSGFGVGLSWGTMVMNFDPTICLPVVIGSEPFDDGGLQ